MNPNEMCCHPLRCSEGWHVPVLVADSRSLYNNTGMILFQLGFHILPSIFCHLDIVLL